MKEINPFNSAIEVFRQHPTLRFIEVSNTGKVMKGSAPITPYKDAKGRYRVFLQYPRHGKIYCPFVDVLVLETFNCYIEDVKIIHLNGKEKDCRIDNLYQPMKKKALKL